MTATISTFKATRARLQDYGDPSAVLKVGVYDETVIDNEDELVVKISDLSSEVTGGTYAAVELTGVEWDLTGDPSALRADDVLIEGLDVPGPTPLVRYVVVYVNDHPVPGMIGDLVSILEMTPVAVVGDLPVQWPGGIIATVEEGEDAGGGGGAVASVNGQTGVVVLDADDVGAAASPVEIITFTEDDLQGPDSYYGEGAVARKLFDWTPTLTRPLDLAGPIPLSGISYGVEVQLFTADSDVPGGDATSISAGYADWYNGYDGLAGFPPEQFVPYLHWVHVGADGDFVPGTTYQVWVGDYDSDVGGQIDVGSVKVALGLAGDTGGLWVDTYGDIRTYAGAGKGYVTNQDGPYAQAEGQYSRASGESTHAEGASTWAQGGTAHAEGTSTHAEGSTAHAEGWYTHAEGEASHAEGYGSRAEGKGSHAEGTYSHARWNGSWARQSAGAAVGTRQTSGISLTSDGNARLSSMSYFGDQGTVFPADHVAGVRALVVSRNSDSSVVKAWDVRMVCAVDDDDVARLVGSPTVTVIAADSGASGWDIACDFDAGGVSITPSGGPTSTVATVEFTEAGTP